jgi:hypothetical protein
VHYWFSAVVRLSVRPPGCYLFSSFLHLKGWNLEYKLRAMYLTAHRTPETWPGSSQKKIRLFKLLLWFLCLKLNIWRLVRATLPWSAAHVAYSLILPKSQITYIRHDGTLTIGNFMLMMKKPKNLEFEPLHPKTVVLASVVHAISCLYCLFWKF